MKAWTHFLRGFILKILYPVLMLAGAFLKSKKPEFQAYIVKLNNLLVMRDNANVKKILLLLPHCIQNSKCDVRLTFDVFKCRRCGNCKIKNLIEIAETYNISIAIATGGTIARKVVKEVRPDAIIAVACERDLSSGIVDTYPIPVIGILNERPFGPCIDTTVSLQKIEDALKWFINHQEK
ncbi:MULTISPECIES: DUF116 domain-containing protein [Thermodesulfovibrio]|uniref:DUF116 domain-containing protein n=1 Tax=Thermodesulfovibrio yellowstonii (strain ATCC 51303 / DSM 11347 / YP87) TaxID=289376 RepID=B5YIL5_THEYD|nr:MULTISPECIES: DUF116 domain-containing protein [Thermodesulfovibrio]ACI21019.1 protein of unknown function [Thermodesulfovibrio yellowstonii DSM 11347]